MGNCEGRGSLEGAGGFAEMLWETGGCCRCWGRLKRQCGIPLEGRMRRCRLGSRLQRIAESV